MLSRSKLVEFVYRRLCANRKIQHWYIKGKRESCPNSRYAEASKEYQRVLEKYERAKSTLLTAGREVYGTDFEIEQLPTERLRLSHDLHFGASLSEPYLLEPGFPYHGSGSSVMSMGCPCCGSGDIDLLGVEEVKPYQEQRSSLHRLFLGSVFDLYYGGFVATFICAKEHKSVLVVSRSSFGGLRTGWFFNDQDYDLVKNRAAKATEIHFNRATQKQIDYLRDLSKRLGCLEDVPPDITKDQACFVIDWFKRGIIPPLDQLDKDWGEEFDRIQGPPAPDWRLVKLVKSVEAREQNEPRIASLRKLGAKTQDETGLFVKNQLPVEVREDYQTIAVWKAKRRVPKDDALPVIMHTTSAYRFTTKDYYHADDVRKMTPEEVASLKTKSKTKKRKRKALR